MDDERPAGPPITSWPRTVFRLVAPVALFAGLYVLAYVLYIDGGRQRVAWAYMTALYTTPFGKFVAIGMLRAGFGILETTFFLGTIELCFALFFVHNFDLVHRVPKLGRWILRAEDKGRLMLRRRRWIGRVAFVGIAAYTAVPFQGTGAIVAAIVGRLLGMGKAKTVAAIALGGYGGIFIVAATTLGIGYAYQAGLDWGLYSTLLLITVVYTLWAGFWSRDTPEEPGEAPPPPPEQSV